MRVSHLRRADALPASGFEIRGGRGERPEIAICRQSIQSFSRQEDDVGTKKTGKGRRKLGRKKRRMRSKIRHRKD
jgi:hypothetical protein